MEINEVAETDNDELVSDTANDAPSHQAAMTTTTAAATEEGWDDNNVGTYDGDNDNEADNTKGGGMGPAFKDVYDKEEDVKGVIPPLVARRVERLKCFNTERERVMEIIWRREHH